MSKDNGLTLKDRNPRIFVVLIVKNASLDFFDTVKQVDREEDGGVHHDQVIDECKKKQPDNTGYWSDEMQKHFVNAPHWSIYLAKGGGQKKRFQCCLNPHYPHQFLYLRAIQGHSGSTANPILQDTVRIYLSRRKWKRIEVNGESWFDSRRSQSQNRQTSCVLHCCESDG